MYIYDISRNIPDTPPYEGDPETEIEQVYSIEDGDDYNLTKFTMCSHTATHIDAPYHFDPEGKKIDEIRLATFHGKCTVICTDSYLTGADMERLLPRCRRRVLIKTNGEGGLLTSAACVLAESKLLLIGIDTPTIGASFDDEQVHRILARSNIVVLENLDLEGIEKGNDYTLSAFPIKLGGLEAAPCRAILFEEEKGF